MNDIILFHHRHNKFGGFPVQTESLAARFTGRAAIRGTVQWYEIEYDETRYYGFLGLKEKIVTNVGWFPISDIAFIYRHGV